MCELEVAAKAIHDSLTITLTLVSVLCHVPSNADLQFDYACRAWVAYSASDLG